MRYKVLRYHIWKWVRAQLRRLGSLLNRLLWHMPWAVHAVIRFFTGWLLVEAEMAGGKRLLWAYVPIGEKNLYDLLEEADDD